MKKHKKQFERTGTDENQKARNGTDIVNIIYWKIHTGLEHPTRVIVEDDFHGRLVKIHVSSMLLSFWLVELIFGPLKHGFRILLCSREGINVISLDASN